MRRKWIPVLLALLVLFSYTLTARAATISDTGWESTPSTEWGSNDTATCTNGKITLTATGYKAIISSYSRTSSLTLKNNTGLKQILSGDMIFEGSGSYTITLPDGSEVNGSGNYTHKASITMESGQSLTISVTSPKSNGAIMKCSYAPTVTESSEKTITCNTASNGTYTVNGNTTTSVSFEVGDTLTLVADPDDGQHIRLQALGAHVPQLLLFITCVTLSKSLNSYVSGSSSERGNKQC